MSPRTKNISLPYHFFRSKVKALKIEVLSINANDQSAEQFTQGLQEGKFELIWKAPIKWYLMKGVESWYSDIYTLTHRARLIRVCMQVWTHCASVVVRTSVIDTCTC